MLAPAVSGERIAFASEAGGLRAYIAGEGRPLLLVHSINAAASAAEMRPLHEHYRSSRTVFTLDLPGFGASERTDRIYTPRLMTDAIHAATAEIRRRCGPQKIDAMALSLSCEFLARAAVEKPTEFRTLALVSPTGFSRPPASPSASNTSSATLGKDWLYRALLGPGWGGALYRGLTKPAVIRYFLQRTWGSKLIDEQLWQYDVLSAREPGAQFAPLYFLSGHLFSANILSVYQSIDLPVWMSHGVRGDFVNYSQQSIVADRSNWRITVFPTGALPHFEVPEAFAEAFDAFQSDFASQADQTSSALPA